MEREPDSSFIFETELNPPLDWPRVGRIEKVEVREGKEESHFLKMPWKKKEKSSIVVDVFLEDVPPAFAKATSVKLTFEIDPKRSGFKVSSETFDFESDGLGGTALKMLLTVSAHVMAQSAWRILAPQSMKDCLADFCGEQLNPNTLPNKERPLAWRTFTINFETPREVPQIVNTLAADSRNQLAQTLDFTIRARAGDIDVHKISSVGVYRHEANVSIVIVKEEGGMTDKLWFWLEFCREKAEGEFSVRPDGAFTDASEDPFLLAVKDDILNHPDWPLLNPEGGRWPS